MKMSAMVNALTQYRKPYAPRQNIIYAAPAHVTAMDNKQMDKKTPSQAINTTTCPSRLRRSNVVRYFQGMFIEQKYLCAPHI